jgi:gamma-glutamyl:cysteine ligase YbdK (ATP-grasp superfamily)
MTHWHTRLDVRPPAHLGTVEARETPRSRYVDHLLAMAIVLLVAASLRGAV